MRASVKVCLILFLAAVPAHAQANQPDAVAPEGDAIRSSLTDLLALATLGTVTTQELAGEVTRSGDDYLVRLPLHGFAAPAGAAVSAVARPVDGGIWDITSMTFPAAGTVESTMAHIGTNRIEYSIGKQDIHVRIDPSLSQPSSFTADLGAVRMRSEQGGNRSEQIVDRYIANGTLSADSADRVSFSSGAKATNWHMTAHAANGFATDALVRTMSGRFSVDGLDRAQGARLLAAARAAMAEAQTPAAGEPPGLSPAQRQALRALVDAISGLLTKFQAEETMNDIRFSAGPAGSGTLGRVSVAMTGDAANDRLNARMDIGLDEFTTSALPAETAAYVPHHVDIKAVLAGVRTGPLMALLRAATAPDADPVALQAQATALFGDPQVRAGIGSLTFDSGPMRMTASARVMPRANGQFGADIHLAATGVDTLIAQAQGKPALQQVLPMIFLAKGMGRMDGAALVWDIALGDGPVTVNGVPFGQPAARKR